MPELEHALRALQVDWPETPDIAAAVRTRIEAEPAGRERVRPRLTRLRAAALALLLVLGGTMAVEPARSAILEALGLKSARVERKAPSATPEPIPRGAPLGAGLSLGSPVSLRRARRDAGFDVVVPGAGLGEPDAVFLKTAPPGEGTVSFVYAAGRGLPRGAETGAGLLVSELQAIVEPVIEKAAGPGTEIERFEIDGDPAVYLSGAPHGFAYVDTNTGDAVFEEQRLAGPTLLVEHGQVLIRIEGRISRDRAIEIARSVTATSG